MLIFGTHRDVLRTIGTLPGFREYHVNQQPRQWFNGLKLWFYGICKGSIVYIIRMAIVEADIDFDKATDICC